jgi:hypothetical protein
MRCDDQAHNNLLTALRAGNSSGLEGYLDSRRLSKADFADPASRWHSSPLIMHNNLELAATNKLCMERFCINNNVIGYTWPLEARAAVSVGSGARAVHKGDNIRATVSALSGSDGVAWLEANNPSLHYEFAPGAPAMITHNAAGNPLRGIANGARCRFHSLTFGNEDILRQVRELPVVNGVVHLPFHLAPTAVNVIMDFPPDKVWDPTLTLEMGRVVVPILYGNSKPMDLRCGSSRPLSVILSTPMVTSSFSQTAHKSQGCSYEDLIWVAMATPYGSPKELPCCLCNPLSP